jgi:hypothetical protein
MEHWSIEDYKNFTNNKVRKSKYNLKIIEI